MREMAFTKVGSFPERGKWQKMYLTANSRLEKYKKDFFEQLHT